MHGVRLARRLQPAALGVPVAFEDQLQAVQGQVLVVVVDGVQLGQQQRCGMSGGHDRDVVAVSFFHVLANAADQAVDQPGKAEHRARLHTFDGVLADHGAGASQLDAA